MKGLIKKIATKAGLLDWIYFEVSNRMRRTEAEAYKAMLLQTVEGSELARIEETRIVNAQNSPAKIKIGNGSYISGAELLIFRHGGQISIGEYCFVGPGTRIWSAERITIGDRVLISHNVNIHDNNSHPIDPVLRHQDFVHLCKEGYPSEANYNEKPISIGSDSWIGYNSIIMKGVTIGKCAIIGAGTIVTEDVPDYAVVVGSPQRIIKYSNQ